MSTRKLSRLKNLATLIVLEVLVLSCQRSAGQTEVAAGLNGLRCEMPCKPGYRGEVCGASDPRPSATGKMGGRPGQLYQVTLRFRGEVEQHSYADGKQDELWYVGGRSAQSTYNIYRLHISDPEQTYYLNAGRAGIRRTWAIDYTRTVPIRAGATVTLSADAQDDRLIVNRDNSGKPIVIPDIPPAPRAYDGQFIQMNLVSVTPGETPGQ